MNQLAQLRKICKSRYNELAELTKSKRTSIKTWFNKNKLDIANDEHFELYKKKILD